MRVVVPAVVYFGLVFAAGFALGVVRTPAAVPRPPPGPSASGAVGPLPR